MKYDFDTAAERRGTDCYKWDSLGGKFGNPEALPFWVADTDYRTAPEIIDEVSAIAAKGAFGYTFPCESYLDSVCRWFRERHSWDIDPQWIVPSSGIVSGIANIIRCFTEEGDGVVVQPPVYNPFYETVERSGRRVLRNWLKGDNISGYAMDFEDLDSKLAGAKMMILCSPHNPVGRVWTSEELTKVAELCRKHDVMLVSDEIHWDLLIGGTRHTCAGAVTDYGKIAVCTAPSKTFNLAGLQTSNLIIPDAEPRERYKKWLEKRFIEAPNLMGMAACRVAYDKCGDWCDQQNAYLTGNAEYVYSYLDEVMPGVTAAKLEGTYLMWLDMRKYGFGSLSLKMKLAVAGAALNDGFCYGGDRYDGFMRLNIACPREQLERGMEAISGALE